MILVAETDLLNKQDSNQFFSLPERQKLTHFRLLKPIGYFTYLQVWQQKSSMMLTLRLCVMYWRQHKQRLLPCTSYTGWFCITEVRSVHCAYGVRP